MKIRPLVGELFRADGWNSHNEEFSRFTKFCERAQ